MANWTPPSSDAISSGTPPQGGGWTPPADEVWTPPTGDVIQAGKTQGSMPQATTQSSPSTLDSYVQGAKHSLGVGTRDILQGGANAVGFFTDPFINAIGYAARAAGAKDYNPTTVSELGENAANYLSLPKAQSNTEKIVSAANQTGINMLGGAGLAGAAIKAAPGAAGITTDVLKFLAENPVSQGISGVGAGGAQEYARQKGYGAVGQLAAMGAGGIGVGMLEQGLKAGVNMARGKPITPVGDLWDSVKAQESHGRQFNPDGSIVTSNKGAIGISQIMPGTLKDAAKAAGLPADLNRLKTDPAYNEALGKAYLGKLMTDFDGNQAYALAAYNAGPGATRRAIATAAKTGDSFLEHLPAETQNYVAKIMGHQAEVPLRDAAQLQAHQLAQRSGQEWEQQPLFNSFTPVEEVAAKREAEANTGQMSFDFGKANNIEVDHTGQLRNNEIPIEPQAAKTVPKNQLNDVEQVLAEHGDNISPISSLAQRVVTPAKQVIFENNPVLSGLNDVVERAYANARSQFVGDEKILGEKYDPSWAGSGAKLGKSGLAKFFTTDSKIRESMLEKMKPWWNKDIPITKEASGMTDAEWELHNHLREGLNAIADRVGISPEERGVNWLPRQRTGDYAVLSVRPDGLPHIEGASSWMKMKALEKTLQNEGHTITTSGLKSDVLGSSEFAGAVNRIPESRRPIASVFSKHTEPAYNISGYDGQRNTKDMVQSIADYTRRARSEAIRQELAKVDKQMVDAGLDRNAPSIYAFLRRKMDNLSGASFLHQQGITNEILKTAQRNLGPFGDVLAKSPSVLAKTFQWGAIMTHPVQRWFEATLGQAQQAATYLAYRQAKGDLNASPVELMSDISKAALTPLTDTDRKIVDRAIQSNYLMNSSELHGLEKSYVGKVNGTLKEIARDPGRIGRMDLVARRNSFMGWYNNAIKRGMDPEEAFHDAGKAVREMYVGLRPADRAQWVNSLGQLAPILAPVTTYMNDLASGTLAYAAQGKNALAPMATLMGTALLFAGARGTPLNDLADPLTMFHNMIAKDQDKVASFDAMMLDYERQHPELRWVISGAPSAATGLNISRNLSWPGISTLIPMFETVIKPALYGERTSLSMPVEYGYNAAKGIASVASSIVSGQPLGAREEQTIANTAPGPLGQLYNQYLNPNPATNANTVLNNRDEQIGTISDKAKTAALLAGSPSLEEKEIRANEYNVQLRLREQKATIQNADNKLINQLLRGDPRNTQSAFAEWEKTQQEANYGDPNMGDPSRVMNAAVDRLIGQSTNPMQRALIQNKIHEFLVRQASGQQM